MNVPFVDLGLQHKKLRAELNKAIENILDTTGFVSGKQVQAFEEEFANYCQSKFAAAVNSGTDALKLGFLAEGIGKGDEVITVSNTFVATAEAILHCNAIPSFIDIDENSYNMSADKIEEAITEKTRAIAPVHLYGQPADMAPILEIAEKHDLKVIEDCAQAHYAEYRGKRVPFGTGCFSFYPSKNLGAIGEGGIVVSNNEEVIEKVKLLRSHGEKPKNIHTAVGFNDRMHEIQGAVLRVKLKYLDGFIDSRRKAADYYNKALSNDVTVPTEESYARHVYHLYVIQTKDRQGLREFLGSKGVSTGIHYPTPIHLQPAYTQFANRKLPVTEKATKRIISLPMFPELTKEQTAFVVEQVKEGLR